MAENVLSLKWNYPRVKTIRSHINQFHPFYFSRLLFVLPYDDIHDQEVSHQADDADDHIDDHDGDLHTCRQQGVCLVVWTGEVVLEERVVVELQVAQLGQQEVIWELHH